MPTVLKDPQAVGPVGYDWNTWLDDGETITDLDVIVPTGLTLVTTTNDAGITAAWIADGTAGEVYTTVFRVTTSAGRVDDRSITIRCTQR